MVRTVPCAGPSQETPLPHTSVVGVREMVVECSSESGDAPSAQGTVRTTFEDIPGVLARVEDTAGPCERTRARPLRLSRISVTAQVDSRHHEHRSPLAPCPKWSDIVVRTVPCAAPSQETPLPPSGLCGDHLRRQRRALHLEHRHLARRAADDERPHDVETQREPRMAAAVLDAPHGGIDLSRNERDIRAETRT